MSKKSVNFIVNEPLYRLAMLYSMYDVTTWILGNVTRIPRHELPQTLDFSDFLPLFT